MTRVPAMSMTVHPARRLPATFSPASARSHARPAPKSLPNRQAAKLPDIGQNNGQLDRPPAKQARSLQRACRERRIQAALARGGESVDDETVRKIMRDLGLEPCQPKPWRFSLTEQDGQAGPIPDLVNRDFTASKPGAKMVGDITYIDTWEGWVYLATVIDCATRKIVGWTMDDNYRTPLISSAIDMAARNLDLPEGAIFHSDRGSNYTSAEFGEKLGELGIRRSVGRTGICYDNALSESVNGTLKNELVYRTAYRTRKAAMDDIARWIELRYNRTRLHSTLGYRTPQEVLDEYLNGQEAA